MGYCYKKCYFDIYNQTPKLNAEGWHKASTGQPWGGHPPATVVRVTPGQAAPAALCAAGDARTAGHTSTDALGAAAGTHAAPRAAAALLPCPSINTWSNANQTLKGLCFVLLFSLTLLFTLFLCLLKLQTRKINTGRLSFVSHDQITS